MEMQVSVKSNKKELFGAEDTESGHYSTLLRTNDDVYSEVFHTDAPFKEKAGGRTVGKPRLYRAACIILSVLCLVLLVVIIVLSTKVPADGSTVCSDAGESMRSSTCSLNECQNRFNNFQSRNPECQQCSDGWLPFDRSCFFLSTVRLSWTESQRNCSARGGSLAVVSNPQAQDFLTNKGKMQYWIGLSNNSGTWTWTDNTVLQTSYWADASQSGDCAILNGGSKSANNWRKASCKDSTYFICQLQM